MNEGESRTERLVLDGGKRERSICIATDTAVCIEMTNVRYMSYVRLSNLSLVMMSCLLRKPVDQQLP